MAALPPAGVNLEARGFNEYVKRLQEIDKQQKAVFEKQFKGTDLSYRQVVAASKSYQRELNNEIKAVQRAERERAKLAEQAERQAQQAAKAQAGGGGAFSGAIAQAAGGFLTLQGLQKGFELTEQAAAFQAQRAGLENLADAYGTSGTAITAAMQRAANGVLSSSDIIQAANKALLLDVAKTPAQFEEITRTAITLGRAMGLTATDAIDQFTTALGRKSLLILDNFGISSKQVRAEMERLAQVEFGKTLSQLEQLQQDSLFTEAALKIANQSAENIGENAGKAAESFERLSATSKNLALATGTAFGDVGSFIADRLTEAATTAGQLFAFVGAGIAGIGNLIGQLEENAGRINAAIGEKGVLGGLREAFTDPDLVDIDIFAAADAAAEKFKDTASAMGVTFGDTTEAVDDDTTALQDNTEEVRKNIEARQKFAREGEKIALNLARAQEDAARKLARSQEKLEKDQAAARDKLFQKQQKELDKLEADVGQDRAKAQEDAAKKEAKARQDAAQRAQDDQRKLFRQLQQAEDRFNLDRLQSRRRFQLSDRRLQAEGDILGLQQLREDFALQEQENRESFDLQQSQTKDNAADQVQEQARALEEQVTQIRDNLREQNEEFSTGLEERRAELLTSFDEEEATLRESQQAQRDQLLESYQEQLEDLRLNRERQLEDLGRSLVEQEGITREGAQRIADELEKAFGEEGLADVIMSGFTDRTESSFQQLFEALSKELTGFSETVDQAAPTTGTSESPGDVAPGNRRRRFFAQHGADFVVPSGHPNDSFGLNVSSGEHVQVTPAAQVQTARMLAPAMSTSVFRHELAGGFNVTGSGTISDRQIEMISERVNQDVLGNVHEAIRRTKRSRN